MKGKHAILLLSMNLLSCVPHIHIGLDQRIFKDVNQLKVGEYELCPSSTPVMFAAQDVKMCPSPKDLETIVSLVQHREVLDGASIIFVKDYIDCGGHPGRGCSDDDAGFVRADSFYLRTARHELTHIQMARRDFPTKKTKGDPEHLQPIWRLIDPPDITVD